MVNFTPQPLNPMYMMQRMLGGPQNRSGCGGEEKKSLPPARNPIPVVQPVSQSHYTNRATPTPGLCVMAFE